jgi:hypothetical protein
LGSIYITSARHWSRADIPSNQRAGPPNPAPSIPKGEIMETCLPAKKWFDKHMVIVSLAILCVYSLAMLVVYELCT